MSESFRQVINPLAIIVAVDEAGGFGKDGKIPWNHPEDLKHFQQLTKGHVCVMGRKTYEDMLEMMKSRGVDETKITHILPDRDSFVITSNSSYRAVGATTTSNIRSAAQSLQKDDHRTIFVIGGERLFVEALSVADVVFMTVVSGDYKCDKFFPISELTKNWKIVEGVIDSNNRNLRYLTYRRKR